MKHLKQYEKQEEIYIYKLWVKDPDDPESDTILGFFDSTEKLERAKDEFLASIDWDFEEEFEFEVDEYPLNKYNFPRAKPKQMKEFQLRKKANQYNL